MDGIPGLQDRQGRQVLDQGTRRPLQDIFGVVMNQDTYNKLSAEDKAAVDSLAGERLARKFGQAWDKSDKAALQIIEANKIQVVASRTTNC